MGKALKQTQNTSLSRAPCTGLRPSEFTYGSLLHAAARSNRLDVAKRAFSAMQVCEPYPTEGCGSSPCGLGMPMTLPLSRRAVNPSQDGGVAVNVMTYTSLMDAFLKKGGSQAADMVFSLFDEMRAAGIAPSAVTYGCLLLACRLQRRVDLAFSLYQQACDEARSAAVGVLQSTQIGSH